MFLRRKERHSRPYMEQRNRDSAADYGQRGRENIYLYSLWQDENGNAWQAAANAYAQLWNGVEVR